MCGDLYSSFDWFLKENLGVKLEHIFHRTTIPAAKPTLSEH